MLSLVLVLVLLVPDLILLRCCGPRALRLTAQKLAGVQAAGGRQGPARPLHTCSHTSPRPRTCPSHLTTPACMHSCFKLRTKAVHVIRRQWIGGCGGEGVPQLLVSKAAVRCTIMATAQTSPREPFHTRMSGAACDMPFRSHRTEALVRGSCRVLPSTSRQRRSSSSSGPQRNTKGSGQLQSRKSQRQG